MDELDRRVRSLEAERLRPVPAGLTYQCRDTFDEILARRQLLEDLADDQDDPETPGPRASAHPTESTREDR